MVGRRRSSPAAGQTAGLSTIFWTVPLVCLQLQGMPTWYTRGIACLLDVSVRVATWWPSLRSGQEKRTKVCDDEACIIMPDRSWSARPATVVPRSGYSCPAGACSAVCRGPIRKSTRTQNLFFISASVDLFFFFFYLPGVVLLVGARVVCSLWWWWSVRSTFPPSHFLLALQKISCRHVAIFGDASNSSIPPPPARSP